MLTSVDLAKLPDISFAPQSAAEVEAEIITTYERLRNVTLQPGDPVRLFLESLAYYITVQNGIINFTGRQNLLAYAAGGHLDHLGAPMGVARIAAFRKTVCGHAFTAWLFGFLKLWGLQVVEWVFEIIGLTAF